MKGDPAAGPTDRRMSEHQARILSDALVGRLHDDAHEECYIANSVLTAITVAGAWTHEGA